MACPFFTTMKLLMAAIFLFYSYFQFIAWRRTKQIPNTQPITENEDKSSITEENTPKENKDDIAELVR